MAILIFFIRITALNDGGFLSAFNLILFIVPDYVLLPFPLILGGLGLAVVHISRLLIVRTWYKSPQVPRAVN